MTNTATPRPTPARQPIAPELFAAMPVEANSAWLVAAIDAIDPHVFEPGRDGAYTRALETLAYQQLAEILALRAAAKTQKPPLIHINGYQLRAVLDMIAPDATPEQLESEACIQWGPSRTHHEGTDPEGLYAWLADYPDEGAIPLLEDPDQTIGLALQSALGHTPAATQP